MAETFPEVRVRDSELLVELRRVTAAFEARVRAANLSAAVPACPGWSVTDLVGHVGRIHEWAAEVTASGEATDEGSGHPAWLDADEAADWYATMARRLLETVESCTPDDPCWNFAHVRETKGFWIRRQVHEAQLHLLDLAQAAGQELELDARLSADGVSEVFEVFMHRMAAKGRPYTLSGAVTLVASDVETVWSLVPDPAAPTPVLTQSDAHSPGDGGDGGLDGGGEVVTGTAEELLTVLWRRRGIDGLVLEGDPDRLQAFLGTAFTP